MQENHFIQINLPHQPKAKEVPLLAPLPTRSRHVSMSSWRPKSPTDDHYISPRSILEHRFKVLSSAASDSSLEA